MAGEAIFIGYRRADTTDVAGRIYDTLARRYGRNRVYKDVDNLRPGVDFGKDIKSILPRCRIALILIGSNWVEAKDESGRRRLDDPQDWVRLEVELALASPGIEIVPVLVNGAKMPAAHDLPECLRPLLLRHAAIVRPDPDFRQDTHRLIKAIGHGLRAGSNNHGDSNQSEGATSFWTSDFNSAPKEQTVWVFRHAQGVSLPPGAGYRADIARPLSEEGRQQAGGLREALKLQGIEFSAVGASPAVRALSSASLIADCHIDHVKRLQPLIPPDSNSGREAYRINFLWDKIGDAPLRGYRTLPWDAFMMDRYGSKNWAYLRKFLKASNPGNVLLVGHAVLMQAIFFMATKGSQPHQKAMRQQLLDHILLQAHGFKVRFKNLVPTDIEFV